LVIAFETFGVADSHIGAVIDYQPAFPEAAMLRSYGEANLYKTGKLLCQMNQVMPLVGRHACVVGDDTDIGIAVAGGEFGQMVIDFGIMIKL